MIDKQEKIMLTTEVLNCDYFNRNRGFNCYKGKNCAEVPDCYYKQIKRKEQECERLKRKCDENKAVISQLQQWQDEDLRQIAELKRIKDDFFKQAEMSHEAVLNKNKIIEKLEKERNKYEQTLINIKEIAKEKANVEYDNTYAYFGLTNFLTVFSFDNFINEEIEVIGNIYENPELLEVEVEQIPE